MKSSSGVGGESSPVFAASLLPQLRARAVVCPAEARGCTCRCQRGAGPGARGCTHGSPLCSASLTSPRCISISSGCTGIAARINFHIEYLGIQPMYILYKYFHLVAAERPFWDEGHSSSLTLRAPSPLDGLRFCGNSWLWVIPTAHCRFHEVLLALAVACGHREAFTVPEGWLCGRCHLPQTLPVPWSNPVDAVPAEQGCCPTWAMGQTAGKTLNPAPLPARNGKILWNEENVSVRTGLVATLRPLEKWAGFLLAQRGPAGSGAAPAGQHQTCSICTARAPSPRTRAREGLQHQQPVLGVHKPCPDGALSHWPQGEEQKTPNFTRQKRPLTPEPTQQLHSNNHWDLLVTVSLYTIKQPQHWERYWEKKRRV